MPIEIKHDRTYCYVREIVGNDGEESFIVVSSPGQGGRTRFVIIHAACDGDVDVKRGPGSVPTITFDSIVVEEITKWQSHG